MSVKWLIPSCERWVRLFSVLTTLLVGVKAQPAGETGTLPRVLTTSAAVRALPPGEASKHLPVRLRGVVTTPNALKNSFFFQDSTAGIAVDPKDPNPIYHAGDLVEIEGFSMPGGFAPSVSATMVRVVGRGNEPQAREARMRDINGGDQDSQWISLTGIIHSAELKQVWTHQVLLMNLDTGAGIVRIQVMDYAGNYAGLVDSLVLVKGVCATVYTDRRQLAGIKIVVPSLKQISVLAPGHSNPVDAPLRPLNGLLQFGQGSAPFHRFRVRGTVTFQSPGKDLYIQDGSLALLVHTRSKGLVAPGTEIEASGFAALGGYSPEMRDAVFWVISKGAQTSRCRSKTSKLQRRLRVSFCLTTASWCKLRERLSNTLNANSNITFF